MQYLYLSWGRPKRRHENEPKGRILWTTYASLDAKRTDYDDNDDDDDEDDDILNAKNCLYFV